MACILSNLYLPVSIMGQREEMDLCPSTMLQKVKQIAKTVLIYFYGTDFRLKYNSVTFWLRLSSALKTIFSFFVSECEPLKLLSLQSRTL